MFIRHVGVSAGSEPHNISVRRCHKRRSDIDSIARMARQVHLARDKNYAQGKNAQRESREMWKPSKSAVVLEMSVDAPI